MKNMLKRLVDRIEQYAQAGNVEGYCYDPEHGEDLSLSDLVDEAREVLANRETLPQFFRTEMCEDDLRKQAEVYAKSRIGYFQNPAAQNEARAGYMNGFKAAIEKVTPRETTPLAPTWREELVKSALAHVDRLLAIRPFPETNRCKADGWNSLLGHVQSHAKDAKRDLEVTLLPGSKDHE